VERARDSSTGTGVGNVPTIQKQSQQGASPQVAEASC
jgi:hypothetical protein